MQDEHLSEINRKLESISNHQDFFNKKLLVLDKIETAILGNEYNKKGMSHMLEDYEIRIDRLEKSNIIIDEAVKENSKKIAVWDKAIAAVIIAVVIFELTKQIV